MNAPHRTILVVDDDAEARLVMAAALKNAGFEVRLAASGEDALRVYDEQASDMVMLDVGLPGMDGFAVCAALRERAGALLPIVMVTGMDDVRSVQAAYDHGATDFVAKPVNWALIGHRVRYLFRSHQAMLDLRAAEARYAAILNAIPDLLFEIDVHGRFLDFRAPDRALLAAPPEAFLGRTVHEVLPPAATETCMAALRQAHETGVSTGMQYELELPGGRRWFELSIARRFVGEAQPPTFIALSRDISERKVAEMRATRLAYTDTLTGLPNRAAFVERVEREIRRAEPQGTVLAVLFVDLDGFKVVNDAFGHAAGDLVLQAVAERLRESLRPSDLVSRSLIEGGSPGQDCEVARLGGDEFTVLLVGIQAATDAVAVGLRMRDAMSAPFVLSGREIGLSASIGIATYPGDGHDAATLLAHADAAMYRAKAGGQDGVVAYAPYTARAPS